MATGSSILAWRIPWTEEPGGLQSVEWQRVGHNGNRWGNSGKSVRLYFLGSKITADGDCSHEIKRRLLLGRKIMTNLDSIFKSRDIALLIKVHLVKTMVFQQSCMDVRVGLWRLSAEELMPLNCVVGRNSWESLWHQDQISQRYRKSILNIHWKVWRWN